MKVMKIVLNVDFGGYGYGVAEEFEELVYQYQEDRSNSELVEFVETHSQQCGDLAVVEIPDDATDWEIDEYDGWERLTYVVNGKIYH